jgi:hypothetical protein
MSIQRGATMSNDASSRRRYSDKEISAILKRATDLQASAGKSEWPGHGISLTEIEQVAAGAGIDPRYVRAAAAELERGDETGAGFNLWGGPMALELSRTVEGELSEEQWESLVQESRRCAGTAGIVGQLGKSLEWTTKEELSQTQLTVSPRQGQTTIQLLYRFDNAAFLAYFLVLLSSVFSGAVLLSALEWSPLLEWSAAGGVVVGTLALTRTLLSAWGRKQRNRLTKLLDRLEAIAVESPPALEAAPANQRLLTAESTEGSLPVPEKSEPQVIRPGRKPVRG